MSLSLYDTARRAVVPFSPLNAGRVAMYHCGPTVYSTSHVGNFRSFLLPDLLRRHLEASGYAVRAVMNITDVGHLTVDHQADATGQDKLLATASQLGWDPYRVARHFEAVFHRDRRRLGIADAHHYPRATEHVGAMLVWIQRLLEAGHAYLVDGEAYFDVSSYPAYGALSGRRVADQRAGARVAVRRGKRSPEDFALWKVDPGHLMQFDPRDRTLFRDVPGGPIDIDGGLAVGFPGWHIECSAMSMQYLGPTFDIHTGGEDNLFPHHECEVAQSTAVTGQPLARWWLHTRHLMVEGRKLSKRDGTALTLDDLAARGSGPRVVRYALLAHHYRKPMNLTDASLVAARGVLARLGALRDTLRHHLDAADGGSSQVADEAAELIAGFEGALDNDLSVPAGLASLFAAVGAWEKRPPTGSDAALALDALHRVDRVLGVLDDRVRAGIVPRSRLEATAPGDTDGVVAALCPTQPTTVEAVLVARHAARAQRDFDRADRLRRALAVAGITVSDRPDGVRWCLQA